MGLLSFVVAYNDFVTLSEAAAVVRKGVVLLLAGGGRPCMASAGFIPDERCTEMFFLLFS